MRWFFSLWLVRSDDIPGGSGSRRTHEATGATTNRNAIHPSIRQAKGIALMSAHKFVTAKPYTFLCGFSVCAVCFFVVFLFYLLVG